MSIPEYVEKYRALSDGEHKEDEEVHIAGILLAISYYLFFIWDYKDYNENFLLLTFSIFFLCSGRIMNKRTSSSKLFFYDLHGGDAKVQVMADARYLSYLSCS